VNDSKIIDLEILLTNNLVVFDDIEPILAVILKYYQEIMKVQTVMASHTVAFPALDFE